MIVRNAESVTGHPVSEGGAEGVTFRMVIGEADDAPSFCMRHFTVAPGGRTPRHQHAWEHEVYVLAGRPTVWTEQGERELAPGDAALIAPDELHQFQNRTYEDVEFLCLVPRTD